MAKKSLHRLITVIPEHDGSRVVKDHIDGHRQTARSRLTGLELHCRIPTVGERISAGSEMGNKVDTSRAFSANSFAKENGGFVMTLLNFSG